MEKDLPNPAPLDRGTELAIKRTDLADTRTEFAFKRTLAAYDRTLLAWVRSAISLITFGFTVYKLFQIEKIAGHSERNFGPREFALTMISIGLFSLLLAIYGHWLNLRALKEQVPDLHYRRTYPDVLAGMIGILGIVALISVFLRQ